MELVPYSPENSIGSSRFIQENIKIEQGASAYSVMASVIATNIEQIDALAESLSVFMAQRAVKAQYDSQYFKKDEQFKSFITRNIYLSEDKRQRLEDERFITGTVKQAVTEASIKIGSRLVLNWLNEQDRFYTCEQIYALLVAYINSAPSTTNKQRALIELNKIRNSFPLSVNQKRKMFTKYKDMAPDFSTLDVSSILTPANAEIKNALAYFLVVIQKQLYGEENDKSNLMNYYSLLDMNNRYGEEVLYENQCKYDNVAADQVAYLQLSRAVVKNIFVDVPNIDMNLILSRSKAMAEYDPYAIRRKKVKGTAKGAGITIAGIITNEPELAFNGISTAISQFLPSDECLATAKEKCQTWGISGNEFDKLVMNSKAISDKCSTSDMNEFEQ